MPIPAEDRPLPQSPATTRRVEYSTCYMCACRCGIQVTLEDDELRFIQGNARPSGQPGRAVREGLGRHHEAALAGEAAQAVAAQARRAARSRRVRRDRMGRGARDRRSAAARRSARTDPRKLAFFTGRDQMQALTGLWAQQFGTPNWAAHGGFCSVNMAAAGLYSIGYLVLGIRRARLGPREVLRAVGRGRGPFVEPDQDRPRQAEAQPAPSSSRSIRCAPATRRSPTSGCRFGPAPTACSRWRSCTCCCATARSTTNSWRATRTRRGSSSTTPGTPGDGLFARDARRPAAGVRRGARQSSTAGTSGIDAGAVRRRSTLDDGRRVAHGDDARGRDATSTSDYAPAAVADALRRRRRRRSSASRARWRTSRSRRRSNCRSHGPTCGVGTHDKVVGRPVAMYAMRGISAHSNGFQTCRALHLLQMLLGALDGPGNFRARAPYPKPHPAAAAAGDRRMHARHAADARAARLSDAAPTISPSTSDGMPLRIDKAYSWESPIAAHGLMHMVIANAVGRRSVPDRHAAAVHGEHGVELGDEHRRHARHAVRAGRRRRVQDSVHRRRRRVRVGDGRFRRSRAAGYDLPRALRRDLAARSADLRARCGRRCDPPSDRCRSIATCGRGRTCWSSSRRDSKFPAFTRDDGARKFADYRDFIVSYERAPGIGFLAGWRGERRRCNRCAARRIPEQWEAYNEHQSFFAYHLPEHLQLASLRQQGLPRIRAGRRLHRRGRADHHADCIRSRCRNSGWRGRACTTVRSRPTPVDRERLATLFRPAAVLVSAARRPRRPIARSIRLRRSRSGR